MKRCLVIGALLGMVCLLAGCGLKDPRVQEAEIIAADYLYVMQELTKVLDEVKDEQTASAAVSKLDALNGKLELVFQRYTNLRNIRQAESDEIKKRLELGLKEVEPKLEAAGMKAAANSGQQAEVLRGALERIHATLEKFEKYNQRNQNLR